jgi:hypothetical protein
MADRNQTHDAVKPSDQRGGTALHGKEAREKGVWAATAREGIVPAELGGSDAPRETLADDPQLGSEVLGVTTGSDEPATETGIDRSGGDKADAVTDGGPDLAPGVEPDLKDIAAAAVRQSQPEPDRGGADGEMAANLAAWLTENRAVSRSDPARRDAGVGRARGQQDV